MTTNEFLLPMVFYDKDSNRVFDAEYAIQSIMVKHKYVKLDDFYKGRISNTKIEVINKKVYLGNTNYPIQ